MSAPSGFLDCFLKFLRGEESETLLTPIKRGRAALYRPVKSKTEGTSCDNRKYKSDRRRKLQKVKDKIEKEKCNASESDNPESDVSSSRDGADIRCGTLSSKEEEIVKEDSNECVTDVKKCEENSSVLEVKEGSSENILVEKQGDEKHLERLQNDLTEIKVKESIGKKIELMVEKDRIDSAAEEKIDENQVRPGKNPVDETSMCSEKDSVISSANTVNQTDEEGVDDSSTSYTERERKYKGKKRKNSPTQEEVPRRTLSARKAKQRAKYSYIDTDSEEDMTRINEESDSDNDPVWVPSEKKASSDEESSYWLGRTQSNWKTKRSRCISPEPFSSKQKEIPKEIKTPEVSAKVENLQNKSNISSSEKKETIGNGTPMQKTTTTTKPEGKDLFYQHATQMPFQSGSFIALKKELEELEEPTIWRVDGKALLQKYEPFRGEGDCLRYRNVSTYSGWGPKNTSLYQSVPVKFIHQNRFEIIVEILQDQLIINEDKFLEKLVKESEKHSYAFEVYLQTLVSQALDSSFLSEIVAEKDEYFVTSMDEMDGVCEEKISKLLKVFSWPKDLKESLDIWPILKSNDKKVSVKICDLCNTTTDTILFELEGQTYCKKTLENLPKNTKSDKAFSACKKCSDNTEMFNKLSHLKFHTYNDCAQLVAEKQAADPTKDNTTILHDILADSSYIKKKFQEICVLWAEADLKSRKGKSEIVL